MRTVLLYGAVLLASATVTFVVTPMMLRLAVRFGTLDEPGGHKSHTSPVPYLGGLALVTGFSVVVLGLSFWGGVGGDAVTELALILGAALALAVVGLLDDIRQVSPYLRLASQVIAAGLVLGLEAGVSVTGVVWLDASLTVLWIVGITNAVNLLDNMDGLSAGFAAIAGLGFFAIAALNGQFLVASLSVGLVGCAAGFLWHNFHPARIYMGDAGSLFLGFLLAYIGIKLRFDRPVETTFFVPILLMGVAIFDTILVVATRLRHGRNPLQGGRDHVSHRLVKLGIPVPVAVSLMYGATVATAWLGLIVSRVDVVTGYLLMGLVVAVAGFLGFLLNAVDVYGTGSTILRRGALWREVAETSLPASEADVRGAGPETQIAAGQGEQRAQPTRDGGSGHAGS